MSGQAIIDKDIFGLLSVGICFIQYIPQIYLMLKGKKKPHAYTRLIWAVMFGVTAAAQYVDHGGAGSWANAASGLFAIAVAVLALRADKSYITRSDGVSLVAALCAIPLWLITKNPLWAVIWSTMIDLIAYAPTVRKAWHKPYEEMAIGCLWGFSKQSLSLLALEHYSFTTMLYPIATGIAEAMVGIYLIWRRVAQRGIQ